MSDRVEDLKHIVETLNEPPTIVIKPFYHSLWFKIVHGNYKYKIATTCLLIGGAYLFTKYLKHERQLEEDIEEEVIRYQDDEEEEDITYLEIDERSFIRRLVAKLWIPLFRSRFTLFDSMQTTKEIEESAKIAAWHYTEIDQGSLAAQFGAQREQTVQTMPDELRYLTKITRILGHFDKSSMMATWKNIDSVEVKTGEYLFKIGDPDVFVYIVLSGLIQLRVKDDEVSSREKFKKEYLKLKDIPPGQQIYSILSFLDVITGHPSEFKTVQAVALEDSVVLKLPIQDFRENWLEHQTQLSAAVRRLVRRVYQVVFVALHKVLGLSTELVTQEARKELDKEWIKDQSLDVSKELRAEVIAAARTYLELEQAEFDEYFEKSFVVYYGRGSKPVRAGTKTNRLVYVHKGELQVTQMMEFQEHEISNAEELKKSAEMEEILYYVPAGEAIGGLSYLTDGVNIFNITIPERALLFVMPEEVMLKLVTVHPTTVLKIAHSIVLRMSSFMRQMDFGLEWCYFESGETVFSVGDDPDSTYLVLSGRLRSIVLDEKGATRILGEYGRDDWVGLIETLTKKKRTKSVVAARDTEMAKIPDGVLHLIKLKFPVVTIRLLDFIGIRVAKSYKTGVHITTPETALMEGPRGCSTIALVPLSDKTPILCFAYELALAYRRFGNAGIVTYEQLIEKLGTNALLKSNDYLFTSWLSTKEEVFDLVIYIADPDPTRWSLKCVRQADSIFILANTLHDSWEVGPVETMLTKEAARAKKELILIHRLCIDIAHGGRSEKVYPQDSKSWLERRPWLSFHHHVGVRQKAYAFLEADLDVVTKEYLTAEETEIAGSNVYSDYSRLSRWISGNSVGVVLGGGGAKGAAHIGMIRAIREQNIPIDMICGVSIGSFVGGLYAMHQDIDLVEKIARVWFGKIGSWWRFCLDMTIPIVSILKGEGFNFAIMEAHGDVQIEDLWLPYFCLSTNITANYARTHRSGMLWRYSRASMTLVGLNPPMCDPIDGHYLMDGGYTNLVPANLMRQMGAKFIIAVDVSAENERIVTNYGDNLSGLKILMHKTIPFLNPLLVPTYFTITEQLAFVQSALYLDIVKKMDRQSIYVRPPLDYFTSGDFVLYRDILLTGYDFGKKLFKFCDMNDSLPVTWQKMSDNLPSVETKPEMISQREKMENDTTLIRAPELIIAGKTGLPPRIDTAAAATAL